MVFGNGEEDYNGIGALLGAFSAEGAEITPLKVTQGTQFTRHLSNLK